MEMMRELLRAQLRRSLKALSDLDRLVAAWPIVCGASMAARGAVAAYDSASATVTIQVADPQWIRQMMSMQGQIAGELARIAGVPVSAIHFEREAVPIGDSGDGNRSGNAG